MSKIISWTIKLGNKKVWVCGTRLGMRENYMMHIRMKRTTGIRKAEYVAHVRGSQYKVLSFLNKATACL